jgi:hypothetical protein
LVHHKNTLENLNFESVWVCHPKRFYERRIFQQANYNLKKNN